MVGGSDNSDTKTKINRGTTHLRILVLFAGLLLALTGIRLDLTGKGDVHQQRDGVRVRVGSVRPDRAQPFAANADRPEPGGYDAHAHGQHTQPRQVVAEPITAAAAAATASVVVRLASPRVEFPGQGVKGAANDRYLILDIGPFKEGAKCHKGDTRVWGINDWERHALPLVASLILCQRGAKPAPETKTTPKPPAEPQHQHVVCHPTMRAPNDHVRAIRHWSRYYLSRGFDRVFMYTFEDNMSKDVLSVPGITWIHSSFLSRLGKKNDHGTFYYSQVRLHLRTNANALLGDCIVSCGVGARRSDRADEAWGWRCVLTLL